MRLLILGVDASGRSCIAEEREIVGASIPGVPGTTFASLFRTAQSPPSPSPRGLGTAAPDNLAPGLMHWYLIDHEPPEPDDDHNPGEDLHWRNAIECVLILQGGGDFILDDGAHPIGVDDCIVLAGSSHGLQVGPDGCKLMAFAIGTSPA